MEKHILITSYQNQIVEMFQLRWQSRSMNLVQICQIKKSVFYTLKRKGQAEGEGSLELRFQMKTPELPQLE